MNKPFTVYFDTSFYVKLCKADETVAKQAISDLNALGVRHVISDVIIRELLTSRDRNALDEALVRRMGRFSLPPYRTRDGLMWEVLLLSGQERIDTANHLRHLHDEMTKAASHSIMADRETDPEQTAKLLEAGKPILRESGFPDDFERNMPQALSAAKAMLEGFGLRGLDWPDEPTPENLLNLSEQIKNQLGPSLVAQLEEERRIQDSSTKTEDRPYQVAAGIATDKTNKRLSNTLRDIEHIMLFVNWRDVIDLLQVDNVQEKIIRRQNPTHPLAELGLLDRCFSADSLPAVVEKVCELKGLLLKGQT
jgi:hypothetical protein